MKEKIKQFSAKSKHWHPQRKSVKHLLNVGRIEEIYLIYSRPKKKKRNIPVISNANYRREMKLIPIEVDYCLFLFDALKFFLGVHLNEGGGVVRNFNIFNVKTQIWQRNRKVHRSDCVDTNFHSISDITFSDMRRRYYNLCNFQRRNFFLLNISGVDEESIIFSHITNI